ncbi:hypothetical protein Scep_001994 [Stephania cephalantha]|uniref:Uncharacterized protein n=1 Tax=Stephania cephalantha TaxID=152367 RepID=A0AAP0LAF7_9MAGN
MSEAQNRRQGHLALAWLAVDGPLCDKVDHLHAQGRPSMETSREEGQHHKASDSMEAVAAAVTAAVEVVEPQNPGEPHHHHHRHEGTESCSPCSVSTQKQLVDQWEVETRIPRSADHLVYHSLDSISARDGYIGTSWLSEWPCELCHRQRVDDRLNGDPPGQTPDKK